MRWPWSSPRPERQPSAEDAREPELRLVQVAYAANLPEAELIQGLLRQERIPSMVRRNGAFDIPDYIAAGGRDILVPVSQADRARELLS